MIGEPLSYDDMIGIFVGEKKNNRTAVNENFQDRGKSLRGSS